MERKKKDKRYDQAIAGLAFDQTQSGLFDRLRELASWLFHGSTNQGRSREEILEYHLTPREREVAYLVALGFTNKEIADALVITSETVKTHVKNILSKMDLGSKVELRIYLSQRTSNDIPSFIPPEDV